MHVQHILLSGRSTMDLNKCSHRRRTQRRSRSSSNCWHLFCLLLVEEHLKRLPRFLLLNSALVVSTESEKLIHSTKKTWIILTESSILSTKAHKQLPIPFDYYTPNANFLYFYCTHTFQVHDYLLCENSIFYKQTYNLSKGCVYFVFCNIFSCCVF